MLGVEQDFENQLEKELRYYIDPIYYTVPDLIGLTKSKVPVVWSGQYNYVYLGTGNTVVEQSPSAGEKIKEGSTIVLYMG